ncbi:MAG: antitoxin family protein [Chloroflexi bacterium]|nr:antitoxin family protein [Chloroflexota bacterium]
MVKLRVRYVNGQFVPLEPVHGLQDGDEIVVEYITPASTIEMLDETLRRTAGMWADIEGIEDYLNTVRQQWDEEWQRRLKSLTPDQQIAPDELDNPHPASDHSSGVDGD